MQFVGRSVLERTHISVTHAVNAELQLVTDAISERITVLLNSWKKVVLICMAIAMFVRKNYVALTLQ